jgi:hypothetical protein
MVLEKVKKNGGKIAMKNAKFKLKIWAIAPISSIQREIELVYIPNS